MKIVAYLRSKALTFYAKRQFLERNKNLLFQICFCGCACFVIKTVIVGKFRSSQVQLEYMVDSRNAGLYVGRIIDKC